MRNRFLFTITLFLVAGGVLAQPSRPPTGGPGGQPTQSFGTEAKIRAGSSAFTGCNSATIDATANTVTCTAPVYASNDEEKQTTTPGERISGSVLSAGGESISVLPGPPNLPWWGGAAAARAEADFGLLRAGAYATDGNNRVWSWSESGGFSANGSVFGNGVGEVESAEATASARFADQLTALTFGTKGASFTLDGLYEAGNTPSNLATGGRFAFALALFDPDGLSRDPDGFVRFAPGTVSWSGVAFGRTSAYQSLPTLGDLLGIPGWDEALPLLGDPEAGPDQPTPFEDTFSVSLANVAGGTDLVLTAALWTEADGFCSLGPAFDGTRCFSLLPNGGSGPYSGSTLVDFSSTAKITGTIGEFGAASGTDYAALALANTTPGPSGTVPEPATWLLLGGSLPLIGSLRRRRNTKVRP